MNLLVDIVKASGFQSKPDVPFIPSFTPPYKESSADGGQAGVIFDKAAVEAEGSAGKFVFSKTLSGLEKVFSFEKKAFVVWTSGPRAGEVYREVDRPSPARIQAAKSNPPLLQEIDRRLDQINRAEDRQQRDNFAGEMYVDLLKAYDGSETVAGLKELELFEEQFGVATSWPRSDPELCGVGCRSGPDKEGWGKFLWFPRNLNI